MGSIPTFHTQAAREAEERLRDLLTERDRATSFLQTLDEMLEARPADVQHSRHPM